MNRPFNRNNNSRGKKDLHRINNFISSEEVRVILDDGEQLGVMNKKEAISIAQGRGMDLVEIAPNNKPPVCKIVDYGKFKYQQSKRNHVARQNQKIVHLKEVKMKPKIEEHDFQFKLRNALRFLEDGDKVKVGVRFMGRQIAHKDLGIELLEKFQAEIGDEGTVEQPITSEGRSMHMILAPPKKRR